MQNQSLRLYQDAIILKMYHNYLLIHARSTKIAKIFLYIKNFLLLPEFPHSLS